MADTFLERFHPISAVTSRTSFSRAQIYEMMKRGEFPLPVKISRNRVAWTESSVAAWIAKVIAAQG